MRSVLIRAKGAAIFGAVSPRRGRTKFAWRSRLWIRSACGHEKPRRSPLHLRVAAVWLVITPPSSASLRLRSAPSPHLSLSRQPSAPTRVVERIVDLCCHPEAMKHHRELSSHGHRRSFLGVFASSGGYLLSVASEVRV